MNHNVVKKHNSIEDIPAESLTFPKSISLLVITFPFSFSTIKTYKLCSDMLFWVQRREF